LDVLEKIGCRVNKGNTSITVTGPEKLSAIHDINMNQFSDTFMTLSIIAPFLPAPTTIHGIAHTRHQESDRIAAVCEGLHRADIHTESTDDSLTIFPGTPKGTQIHSHHDHRIAMAFSILGLKAPGIMIEEYQCVSKTCPLFFEYLTTLGEPHVQ
jgi:3-phosphoshikimate 1-carboxyvinyltransferase